eukprot:SAG22_NODE_1243_length_5022_cov_3.983953_7_plen_105_part_00
MIVEAEKRGEISPGRTTIVEVDVFVAGAGTGGTLNGVGRYLTEQNPDCQVVCVEPTVPFLLGRGRLAGGAGDARRPARRANLDTHIHRRYRPCGAAALACFSAA